MIIGVPKEIKNNENRVGLTPAGAYVLANHGHTVLVEQGAGAGSSFTDQDYVAAGGIILANLLRLAAGTYYFADGRCAGYGYVHGKSSRSQGF